VDGEQTYYTSKQLAVLTETVGSVEVDACKLKMRPGLLKELRYTSWCGSLMGGINGSAPALLSTDADDEMNCWNKCASKNMNQCLYSIYHRNNNTCWLVPSAVNCIFTQSDSSSTFYSSVRRTSVLIDKYFNATIISGVRMSSGNVDEWNLDCIHLCEITLNCVSGYYYKLAPINNPSCILQSLPTTSSPSTGTGYVGFKFI